MAQTIRATGQAYIPPPVGQSYPEPSHVMPLNTGRSVLQGASSLAAVSTRPDPAGQVRIVPTSQHQPLGPTTGAPGSLVPPPATGLPAASVGP